MLALGDFGVLLTDLVFRFFFDLSVEVLGVFFPLNFLLDLPSAEPREVGRDFFRSLSVVAPGVRNESILTCERDLFLLDLVTGLGRTAKSTELGPRANF